MAKVKKRSKKSKKMAIPYVEEALGEVQDAPIKKIKNSVYEKELFRLQLELVKLQAWIAKQKLRVVVIFEGRDAAERGGSSNGLINTSILVSAEWWHFPHRQTGKLPSGISNAMSPTFLPLEKWCCLIAVGITGPVLSG